MAPSAATLVEAPLQSTVENIETNFQVCLFPFEVFLLDTEILIKLDEETVIDFASSVASRSMFFIKHRLGRIRENQIYVENQGRELNSLHPVLMESRILIMKSPTDLNLNICEWNVWSLYGPNWKPPSRSNLPDSNVCLQVLQYCLKISIGFPLAGCFEGY